MIFFQAFVNSIQSLQQNCRCGKGHIHFLRSPLKFSVQPSKAARHSTLLCAVLCLMFDRTDLLQRGEYWGASLLDVCRGRCIAMIQGKNWSCSFVVKFYVINYRNYLRSIFDYEQVTRSWLEGEYLRSSFAVVLKYLPRDQDSFMIREDLWNYYFYVNYNIQFPYDGPCQRSGWMVDSSTAASFVVGNPRFQVPLPF